MKKNQMTEEEYKEKKKKAKEIQKGKSYNGKLVNWK